MPPAMAKRIKLKIQRNRLPDIDILWAIKEREGRERCTVANLLAEVNHAIPLESGDWTLDQYVVELDNYECLHYQFLSDILKDGDDVTIRPLASSDVKARRLGGRTQITGEGFHILDGVPYGMQPNQRPIRPSILIPSRKRRRPELEEEDHANGPATIADLEDDEDLLAHVNGGHTRDLVMAEIEEPEENGQPRKKQKNVHFTFVDNIPDFQIEEEEDDDDDDDEDYDFDSQSNDSNGEEETDEEIPESIASDDDSGSEMSSEVSSSSEDGDTSSEVSVSSTDSAASLPELLSAKQQDHVAMANGVPDEKEASSVKDHLQTTQSVNIPYGGTTRTRQRNKRRRIRIKMLARVRSIIGPTATKEECSKWLQANSDEAAHIRHDVEAVLSDPANEFDDDEEMFEGFSENGHTSPSGSGREAVNGDDDRFKPDTSTKIPNATYGVVQKDSSNAAPLVERENDLSEAANSGGLADSPAETFDPIDGAERPTKVLIKRSSPTLKTPESKRVRLNIDGSRRAIFGALGQRTPKTQQDADRVRSKLAGLGTPKSAQPTKLPAQAEDDTLSNGWRSKILLMAVDCDNPDVKLSEPPYPFKQRWDPSQQRSNWWTSAGKQRKKKARNSYGQGWDGSVSEVYDEEGDLSYLDYDEHDYHGEDEDSHQHEPDGLGDYADGEENMAEYADIQLRDGADAATAADDLPTLQADISKLPDLKEADLKEGAIIAFKQLECSQATNWAPVMSAHRTAQVVGRLENGATEVKLAIRDRDIKTVKYDQDGRRVYEKFEMDDGEEDEVDDGLRELNFAEMVDAKLVQVAADVPLEGSRDQSDS